MEKRELLFPYVTRFSDLFVDVKRFDCKQFNGIFGEDAARMRGEKAYCYAITPVPGDYPDGHEASNPYIRLDRTGKFFSFVLGGNVKFMGIYVQPNKDLLGSAMPMHFAATVSYEFFDRPDGTTFIMHKGPYYTAYLANVETAQLLQDIRSRLDLTEFDAYRDRLAQVKSCVVDGALDRQTAEHLNVKIVQDPPYAKP